MEYTPAQRKLIEKYQNINTDEMSWCEHVITDFKTVANAFGVAVDDTFYSGFWSQGDGASFTTTRMSLLEILEARAKVIESNDYGDPAEWSGYVKAFDKLYELVYDHIGRHALLHPEGRRVAEETQFHVYRCGHYYHDKTMYIEADSVPEVEDVEACVGFDSLHFEGQLRDALRECASELYDSLEEEYEFQTSDDQVWEMIVACGFDKEEAEDEEAEEDAA